MRRGGYTTGMNMRRGGVNMTRKINGMNNMFSRNKSRFIMGVTRKNNNNNGQNKKLSGLKQKIY